jgi:maleamate amidohydrolase
MFMAMARLLSPGACGGRGAALRFSPIIANSIRGGKTMAERVWDPYLSERDREVFAAAGFGARAGFGKRPVLLVVDVNYAFCGEAPEPILEAIKKWRTSCGEAAWQAMPSLQRLIEACRAKRLPVIYTTGDPRADGWAQGGWAWKRSGKESGGPRPKLNRDGNEIVRSRAPFSGHP